MLEQLNVVSAFGRNFALKKNVGVSVDQAGKYGGLRQIDEHSVRREVRWLAWGACIRDVGNYVSADGDDLVATSRARHTVNQHTRPDDCHGCRHIFLSPARRNQSHKAQ